MNNQKVTYLEYNMHQLQLPSDLEDWIDPNDICYLIHYLVENMDETNFESCYQGGGRSCYHPKMMLKVILYAYVKRVTSRRKIAAMCRESIPMIWLAGRQTPDFRTINRFRSERMRGAIDSVFEALILQLVEENYIDPSQYFLDGTKIEANANKYSFVWSKATKNFQEKLQTKIAYFLEKAAQFAKEETEEVPALGELTALSKRILQNVQTKEITSNEVQEITEKLEELQEQTKDKDLPRKEKTALRKLTKEFKEDYFVRLKKYEDYQEIAGERNSFSKTDPDATFMRMKEDHMKNGQLKAGYNIQMGTQNQFIRFFTLHPNPNDTRTFPLHMEKLKEQNLDYPQIVIADGGYGSENNYLYCYENKLEALIPYSQLRKEEKKNYKNQIKYWQNWEYHREDDYFVCPNNRFVEFQQYRKKTDAYGQKKDYKIYKCESCQGCPVKEECTKAKGNLTLQINPVYEECKADVRQKLIENQETKDLYAQRKIEPETVFGNLKANLGCRRFVLRGKEKVHIEFGLYAMAHNLIKWFKKLQEKGIPLRTRIQDFENSKIGDEIHEYFISDFLFMGQPQPQLHS